MSQRIKAYSVSDSDKPLHLQEIMRRNVEDQDVEGERDGIVGGVREIGRQVHVERTMVFSVPGWFLELSEQLPALLQVADQVVGLQPDDAGEKQQWQYVDTPVLASCHVHDGIACVFVDLLSGDIDECRFQTLIRRVGKPRGTWSRERRGPGLDTRYSLDRLPACRVVARVPDGGGQRALFWLLRRCPAQPGRRE